MAFPECCNGSPPCNVKGVCRLLGGQHSHGAWFGCCTQARMGGPETAAAFAEAEAT